MSISEDIVRDALKVMTSLMRMYEKSQDEITIRNTRIEWLQNDVKNLQETVKELKSKEDKNEQST